MHVHNCDFNTELEPCSSSLPYLMSSRQWETLSQKQDVSSRSVRSRGEFQACRDIQRDSVLKKQREKTRWMLPEEQFPRLTSGLHMQPTQTHTHTWAHIHTREHTYIHTHTVDTTYTHRLVHMHMHTQPFTVKLFKHAKTGKTLLWPWLTLFHLCPCFPTVSARKF